jgi:hypothetical protein
MAKQSYLVGETVVLVATSKDPSTGELVDPAAVILVSLKHGTTSLDVTGLTVVHVSLGTYKIIINTTGFQPATYTWLVRFEDAGGHAALSTDYFVLTAV